MVLKKLLYDLTVCKVKNTEDIPQDTVERDDGWKGFRIQDVLDFSQIGILLYLLTIQIISL